MSVRLLKIMDATIGLFLCWAGGRLLFLLHREAAFSAFRTEDIKRILVIRPGGLGDMVLLQPMLKKIHEKYPGALIDLICERRNEDILKLSTFPMNVFTYDAHPLRLLRRLWAGGYDVVIDSEQFHYFSAVMALLSRASIRIGYKINPGRNPIYTHLITYNLEGYEADEFMKLLGPFGVCGPAEVSGCLAIPDVTLPEDVASWLGKVQKEHKRLMLVHVGASIRYKTWAFANFIELLQGLCRNEENSIGLAGGCGDCAMASELAERCGLGDRVKVLAGRLSIVQTAKLLSGADLFVGGDSGIAHLAAAYDVPEVVMFGPSDAKKWCRESDTVAVVRKEMACSPCFIFGYHKYCRTIACMQAVGVKQVLEACHQVGRIVPMSRG
ncbi:MAG: glycosyltransferase family 9 protein [bacterium]